MSRKTNAMYGKQAAMKTIVFEPVVGERVWVDRQDSINGRIVVTATVLYIEEGGKYRLVPDDAAYCGRFIEPVDGKCLSPYPGKAIPRSTEPNVEVRRGTVTFADDGQVVNRKTMPTTVERKTAPTDNGRFFDFPSEHIARPTYYPFNQVLVSGLPAAILAVTKNEKRFLPNAWRCNWKAPNRITLDYFLIQPEGGKPKRTVKLQALDPDFLLQYPEGFRPDMGILEPGDVVTLHGAYSGAPEAIGNGGSDAGAERLFSLVMFGTESG